MQVLLYTSTLLYKGDEPLLKAAKGIDLVRVRSYLTYGLQFHICVGSFLGLAHHSSIDGLLTSTVAVFACFLPRFRQTTLSKSRSGVPPLFGCSISYGSKPE